MNPAYQAALEAQTFFQRRAWQFCIMGGSRLSGGGAPASPKTWM